MERKLDFLDVKVLLVESPDNEIYHKMSEEAVGCGNALGNQKFGEEGWHKKQFPSEEKLRICTLPQVSGRSLTIDVTPYQWSDLQAYKQVQPDERFGEKDERRYFANAIALTANGLIQTGDGKLIFHFKKGGAAEGSIHTFGGYVSRQDIEAGGIEQTIVRELSEKDEVGLKRGEMLVDGLFGTLEKMPAILWDFGTGAIYGLVKTNLSSAEIQDRVKSIDAGESLIKRLYVLPIEDVKKLETQTNIHPQTRLVLPIISGIYGAC